MSPASLPLESSDVPHDPILLIVVALGVFQVLHKQSQDVWHLLRDLSKFGWMVDVDKCMDGDMNEVSSVVFGSNAEVQKCFQAAS